MLIRPARADDFDAIAAITNHYIRTTAIHFAYEPVTVDDLRSGWQRTCKRYPFFVAEDPDARVAGFAKAGVWRDRTAYAWTAEVGLYIEPGARGQGVGTALYEKLLDEVRERGFRTAVAGITLPNEPSLALHRRFGFEYVGTFHDVGWKLDAWHSVEWWQKLLAHGPEGPKPLP